MRILLVDDHPMTVEGYKNAMLSNKTEEVELTFTTVNDCTSAYERIMDNAEQIKQFDLAFIDQGLPSMVEKELHSGSDLALFLREIMPKCKIVMITAHTEVIMIYDIMKKVQPDGLVIKNDVTPENIPEIIESVMSGNGYKSEMVRECIQVILKKDLMVEDNNRQILLYLSKGFKIKELEMVVNLSASTIQKRIIKMKEAFGVADDGNLVKEAINQGFI